MCGWCVHGISARRSTDNVGFADLLVESPRVCRISTILSHLLKFSSCRLSEEQRQSNKQSHDRINIAWSPFLCVIQHVMHMSTMMTVQENAVCGTREQSHQCLRTSPPHQSSLGRSLPKKISKRRPCDVVAQCDTAPRGASRYMPNGESAYGTQCVVSVCVVHAHGSRRSKDGGRSSSCPPCVVREGNGSKAEGIEASAIAGDRPLPYLLASLHPCTVH